ncbi:MAG: alpha/beta hydrolase [Chloroflexota bacterium]|nr:alpha/beta hydrolase [Chloroflexota bacterium]
MPDDRNLFYRDHNPGGHPAVLLIHGLGATSDSWQLQAPALAAAGYRVVVPDLPGFGRSPVSFPVTVPRMAAGLDHLLRSLNAAPAHVVGISMGGAVALQFAVDFPQSVAKLVLVNTLARLQPKHLAGWLAFASRLLLVYLTGLPAQARVISERIFPKPGQEALRQGLYKQILQADPRVYRAAILALGRLNLLPRLAGLRVPTLVVTAQDDRTIAPANQAQLLAIPGSRQVVVANAGHGVIAERPEIFNRELLAFLTAAKL